MAMDSILKVPLVCEVPLSPFFESDLLTVQNSLQTVPTDSPSGSYVKFSSDGLSLIDHELGRLHLDFRNDLNNYSRSSHRGKSELIAKALGLPKGPQKIFDATLGLAQDAWFLSQLGAEVEGCERSPVVFLLLSDALRRSEEKKLKIHFGDSKLWLSEQKSSFTAIYLDPMFPEKKKSALPRKEMQIFRKWVGEDLDADELFSLALQSGAERIVLKRPLKSPDFRPGVIHSFRGTTVRYDLYAPSKG
jgi:16S rRNA (guanine1516-N2)-methyltransferase